jgi:hypothetical protein
MNVKASNFDSPRTGNPVANQFIIEVDDKTIFQSYDSIIAIKHGDGSVELGKHWNYSRTTGKYRNEFLGESIAETRAKIQSGEYTLNEKL